VSLDHLVPLAIGLAGLAAFALLLVRAWGRRPAVPRKRKTAAHTVHTGERAAYHLSRARVICSVLSSLLLALALGLALAGWLPLPPLENTLLATMLAPLFWSTLAAIFLAHARWKPVCVCASAVSLVILGGVAAPLAGY